MRKPLVAGNWKMNGSEAFLEEMTSLLGKSEFTCDVLICPPFVYLERAAKFLAGTDILVGGQNLDWHESGAYTGEIAPAMLVESGCTHVLVGHSERRSLYGESDEVAAAKFKAALDANLIPVLCVGETDDEREAGQTEAVVKQQIEAVIAEVAIEDFSRSILAYEPVWAIGTGKTATPHQAEEVHEFIRGLIAEKSEDVASNLRILYGGSVNENTAEGLFKMPNIDGALVGGASLKIDAFPAICRAVG